MSKKVVGFTINLLLFWLLIVCCVRLLVLGGDFKRALIPNIDPWLQTETLAEQLSDDISAGRQVDSKLVKEIARKEPLNNVVFLAGAIEAAKASSAVELYATAEHMLRLKPRSELAREVLVHEALGKQEYKKAISILFDLLSLKTSQLKRYINWLAEIANNEQGRVILRDELLRVQPKSGGTIAARIARQTPDPTFFHDLYKVFPSVQSLYLNELVKRGDSKVAYEAFLDLLPEELSQNSAKPFDNQFVQVEAPQPFNWKIVSKNASFKKPSGLSVRFFGRGQSDILKQLSALEHGKYEFRVDMKGAKYPEAMGFKWQLKCNGTKSKLFNLKLNEISKSGQTFVVPFNVNEGCVFQELSLQGVPGLFSRTIRAEIMNVSFLRIET